MKKPTESDLKRNSAAIKKFLEELVKIGNQHEQEAATFPFVLLWATS